VDPTISVKKGGSVCNFVTYKHVERIQEKEMFDAIAKVGE
jgi:hypothetical protein